MAMNVFGKFGSLSGIGDAIGDLVDGLAKSGMGSQGAPSAQVCAVQEEIAGLQQQEASVLAEIGRQAFAANPLGYEQGEDLRRLQADIAAAKARLAALHEEEEKARLEEQARLSRETAVAATRCPACGRQNHEGVKFCQECGTKLDKAFCVACGAELAQGVRFCGACGVRQAE